MADHNRFRYVTPQVGAFLLITLLLGGVGIFLAGRVQGWFEEQLHLETLLTELPPDSTLGLSVGAEVQIFGNIVGSVQQVSFQESDVGYNLHVQMIVQGGFIRLVRDDSRALVKKKFGFAGSTYIQITAGHGNPLKDGAPLLGEIVPDILATLEATLDDYRGEDSRVQKVLENVQTITANLAQGRGAVGHLLAGEGSGKNLGTVLSDVAQLTTGLRQGEGVAGMLLSDAKTAQKFQQTLDTTNESLDSIKRMLATAEQGLIKVEAALNDLQKLSTSTRKTLQGELKDIQGLVAQLRGTFKHVDTALGEVSSLTSTVLKEVEGLPLLLLQTQELMRQTTRLIEGLQKTWLLRGHVEPDQIIRLSPSDVTTP